MNWLLTPPLDEGAPIRAMDERGRVVGIAGRRDIPEGDLWFKGHPAFLRGLVEACGEARFWTPASRPDGAERGSWSFRMPGDDWRHIRSASTWSEGGDIGEIAELSAMAASPTPGSMTRRAIAPALRFLKQAPRPVRALHRVAIHGGPVSCYRVGVFDGVMQLDRRAAFLHSLSATKTGRTWRRVTSALEASELALAGQPGAFFGSVYAPKDGRVPWLPVAAIVDDKVCSTPATGELCGAWTLAHLGAALRSGAEIGDVGACWVAAEVVPIGEALAEELMKLPKGLQKLAYTRAWGIMGAGVGLHGSYPAKDGFTREGWPGWTWRMDQQDSSEGAAPHDRPDIAAHVAGHNLRTVVEMARRVPIEDVQALHVDAVWADEPALLPLLTWEDEQAWKVKHSGRVQHFAPGIYIESTLNPETGRYSVSAMASSGRFCRSPSEVRAYGREAAETLVKRAGNTWGATVESAEKEGDVLSFSMKDAHLLNPPHNPAILPAVPRY